MGMLELSGKLDFPSEPFDVYPGGKFRREYLDNHLSLESTFGGHEHARHSRAAEFPLNEEVGVEGVLQAGLEVAHRYGGSIAE